MKMTIEPYIAGALFDFLGYLTSREEPLTMSSHHEVPLALEALQAWADARGLSLDDADVKDWQHYASSEVAALAEIA